MSGKMFRLPVSPLHLLNYHAGRFHCDLPGCKCEEGLKSTPIERHPVLRRVPVPREHLAMFLTKQFECQMPGCPCQEASKYFAEVLYESIHRMVVAIARSYSITCIEKVEDLSQRCFERIQEKLCRFDPKKGQFTTWAWTVSANVLKREHKRNCRYNKIFLPLEEKFEETIPGNSAEPFLRTDMMECVNLLRIRNPKWRDVLDVMFGKPGDPLPCSLSVTEIAKETNRPYNQVHLFLTRTIRPFFKTRFPYKGATK